ncbi:protein spinster isoform X1 [Onthophagus taurus]|uniref:protein spinster isoform X1 n=1 Tax=Onthophagus taurus TaxID=166361 RepID=UPI000C201EB4|nr:protein spinster isoform X2 [Onthophagus taurus]
MPPQNVENSDKSYTLKEINNKMPSTIPSNRSSEQLVNSTTSEEPSEENVYTDVTLRDIKCRDWIIMFILCFVNLINYMDRFTLAGILEDIKEYFEIRDDYAGLLQTSFILSYMFFAPLFGFLGDRYSRKWIMAFGVAMWSITTLLGSFMTDFVWFIVFRALVGIGEASYSTIAPTIISDLFVKDVRSKMLAFFYFAIPVGSGLGYIIGAQTAHLMGSWQWSLRVTPALGLLAVLLIVFVIKDPVRGQSENSDMVVTPWKEDLQELCKNKSFMLSTAGFTCVAFVAGALAWWGPNIIYLGIRLQPGMIDVKESDVAFTFGVISMISGLMGVPCGSFLAQRLRSKYERVDPYVCAFGLMVSAPLIYLALIVVSKSTVACYILVFFGEFFLNMNWSIVTDIMLYVVLPTRRATAAGFQLLVSHALGDAGSPYLIGVISEALKIALSGWGKSAIQPFDEVIETTTALSVTTPEPPDYDKMWIQFRALQYSIFTTCFVEVLGGFFFLATAIFIVKDRKKIDDTIKDTLSKKQVEEFPPEAVVSRYTRNGFE